MSDFEFNLKTELKDKGYKMTSQRKAILDVLIENDGKHLSTEEIYELVKKKYPEIGVATVYRTLLLFDSMELVYKLDFDDGCSRYELNKNKEDHRHHHLICMGCGSVSEVEEDLLDSLEEEILNKKGFVVKDHRVKFYGFCKKCFDETGKNKIPNE